MTTKPHSTHKQPAHPHAHAPESPYAAEVRPRVAEPPPAPTPMTAGGVKVDHNTLKSPATLQQAVNASYGTTVVTNFGLLDPTLAEKQINAALAGASKPAAFHVNGPKDRGITDPHWTPDGLSHAMGLT